MSRLIIRYSEGYDAAIGGWTGALDQEYFENNFSEWETNYLATGQRFAADCQRIWDGINDSVYAAFRSFGYQFADQWLAYCVHSWANVVPFKDPLTITIGDNLENACNSLIHELVHCHEDYPDNQPVYEPVRQHIFARFPEEHIAVRYHLVTNSVEGAVLRRVFPNRWRHLIAHWEEHPLLARTARILGEHEAQIDYDDPLGSLLNL